MNWVLDMDKFPLFSFDIFIKINSENYKEIILSFDSSFLELSNKYELYQLYKEEVNHTSSFIKNYVRGRKNSFFSSDSEFSYLSLLDLKQEPDFISYSEIIQFTEPIQGEYQSIYRSNTLANPHENILQFTTFGEEQLSELEYEEDWESEVYMSISSYSNIWLDIINKSEIRRERKEGELDNRGVAYRLTPRLNSFLRDLRKLVKEYGGHFSIEQSNPKYVTSEGVLLDGKIIYQEDIDEGRVKLPQF